MDKLRIGIMGSGNTAFHLGKALKQAGLGPNFICGRNHESIQELAQLIHCEAVLHTQHIPACDLLILAISDSAIAQIQIPIDTTMLVVHCSGMAPMHSLNAYPRHGVFYPLQTMSKGIPLHYADIPFCIEANQESDAEILMSLAQGISKMVFRIDSRQRQLLHTAAVFANNFSNALFGIAESIAIENQLPFDLLKPLILETAHKATVFGPQSAQTGPARRGDIKTMEQHVSHLKDPDLIAMYELISQYIQKRYQKV